MSKHLFEKEYISSTRLPEKICVAYTKKLLERCMSSIYCYVIYFSPFQVLRKDDSRALHFQNTVKFLNFLFMGIHVLFLNYPRANSLTSHGPTMDRNAS